MRLWSGNRVQVRQLGPVSNYLSQGSQRAYFGLGEEKVDSCKIYWPDGIRLSVSHPANKLLEVERKPARLVLEPDALNFGSPPLRKKVEKSFKIQNRGEARLELTGISVEPVEYLTMKTVELSKVPR
ncbi:MAG: ASPIC/UnbV domain-containing protein [Candidatus Handelsmanbacteria bacterium]|nr:ASPIC/UnbV domain-containing protein [Candidatus Handelsmanbacteria bacterium]